jgi:hypothetical protein
MWRTQKSKTTVQTDKSFLRVKNTFVIEFWIIQKNEQILNL